MRLDIEKLLTQRGHKVVKQGTPRDILLPVNSDVDLTRSFNEILFRLMQKEGFRKSLRDWSYNNIQPDNIYLAQIEAYITLIERFDGRVDDDIQAKKSRYGTTFEWYVSELMIREFAARASGFNIRLGDAHPDDEFDCIAVLDNGLAFIECKTGKGDLYREAGKFVRRDAELSARYSFFFFDRSYTFQRGPHDLPGITRDQAQELGIRGIRRVAGRGPGFFFVDCGDRYFLAASAIDGFDERVRHMLRFSDLISEIDSLPTTIYTSEVVNFLD